MGATWFLNKRKSESTQFLEGKMESTQFPKEGKSESTQFLEGNLEATQSLGDIVGAYSVP